MMTYLTSVISFIGLGGVFAIVSALIVGTFLYFNKNEVVRKIAIGLVVSAIVLVFFSGLYLLSAASSTSSNTALSPILSLAGGILYICSLLCGFIKYIAGLIKPNSEDKLDPANDKKVALIIKWKKLMEDKIITEDEFMAKRNELLDLN